MGVLDLRINIFNIEKNATVDTGMNKKGVFVIGNNDYFSGKVSVFINNHSDKDIFYLGENNTPYLVISKEVGTGSIRITNNNNENDLEVYIRILPLI